MPRLTTLGASSFAGLLHKLRGPRNRRDPEPAPTESFRRCRMLLERPHAVGVARSLECLGRRWSGHSMGGEVRAACVELGLPLLPHLDILAAVVVEALGACRGEAREDLVARIAMAAAIGVVAMAKHADAVLAAVGHAPERLVLVRQ